MNKTPKAVRRKGRAVTIDEVAQHAGVSPMTVSRVINGHAGVRDANRERVQRSVRELGYRPNAAASALAAAQNTSIALIYTNPSSNYLRELLVGALRGLCWYRRTPNVALPAVETTTSAPMKP